MTVQGIEAAQPSQSLSAIRELITGNLSNGDFHFSAQDFSAIAIKQMLTRFFGTDSLLFNNFNLLADTPDEYRISANLQNQFLNTSNLEVVLSFTRDTDNVQLKATFGDYPLKWKLSTAFTVLQGSLTDEFLYSEVAFTLDSQKAEVLPENFPQQFGFPADPNMGDEVVVNGLSFSAQVSVIPENTALDWLLFGTGISTVKIEGPISLVNSKPVFWFVSAGGKTFDVFGQSLPLSLELSGLHSAQPATPENYKVLGRISAIADYKLKSGSHSITVAAKFERLDSILLLLEANTADAGIELSIEDVATVLGIENPGSFIPDNFPLAKLQLDNVGATLNTVDKKIQQAYITIGNDATWQPFGEWLSFNGFKIRFSTGFTAATTNVAAFSTANVLGTSIDSYIELPTLSFGLALSPGSSIEIGHMFSDMGITVPGLMNSTCSVFSLTGNIKSSFYSVMCQLKDVWQLTAGGMTLNLNEVSLRLTRSSMGNGAYLEAQAQIGQTAFQLMANHFEGTNYWQFQGNTLTGTTIPLQQIAADVGSLFGASVDFPVDDLQLTAAKVNFDTRGNFLLYADAGVQVNLPFAQNSVGVKTIVNLNATIQPTTNKRLYTGYFEGNVTVGKAIFTVRFDMGTAKTISGMWHNQGGDTTISLKDITDLVGLENVIQVPSSLDLSLTAAGLFYDITNERFTLAAASLKYGTAFFTAGKDSNKSWGFVFGVTLTGFNKLSDIPGIGSYLTPTDFITFEQMSVMVCSGTFNNYVVPKLPTIPTEAIMPGNPVPATTTSATPVSGQASLNIAPGISLAAIMDLKTTGSGNVVFKNLNSVVNQAKLVTQASFGSSGVSLFVGLDGGAGIPDGKGSSLQMKKVGLQVTLGDIMVVQLIGAVDFTLNGSLIEATSRLIISETQAQAAINIESDNSILPLPPGLKGIKLKDFGMMMGVFFEPPGLDVGMEGKVQIGDDALKDDSFAFVLQIIEEVPNPLYLSFYLDEIDMGRALQVFTDVNDSKIITALSVVKATNVSFYWCENIVVLPDGTIAQPGFGFSGMINVFGFGFMGEFMATVATGIHGKAQVAPVNIKDVLKLSGDGKTITRNTGKDSQTVSNTAIVRTNEPVQQQVMVAGGGPVFSVSTSSSPFLHLDFKASLFDVIDTAVDATIDSKGISFSLEFNVANIEKFNLTCTLTNWTNFKGNATFRFGINETIGPIKVLGINAGSVHLQVSASVDLGVILNSDVFSLTLDASFGFMGSTLRVPHIAISVAPKSLAQLPGVIVKEIKDAASSLFAYLFENAEKWAKYIGQGIITGVEDMAGVLKDAYKVTAEEAARLMKAAGKAAEEVAAGLKAAYSYTADKVAAALKGVGYAAGEVAGGLKSAYALTSDGVAQAMKTAGYIAADVANGLKSAFSLTSDAAATAMRKAGYAATEVADGLKTAYSLAGQGVATALKSAGYAASEVASGVKSAFSYSEKQVAGVLRDAGYTAGQAAQAIRSAFNLTEQQVAAALKGAGYVAGEIAQGLKDAYGSSAQAVATIMKGIGYGANEVSAGITNAYKLSAKGAAEALKGAGYAINDVAGAIGSTFHYTSTQVAGALKDAGYAASQVAGMLNTLYGFGGQAVASTMRAVGYSVNEVSSVLKNQFRYSYQDMAKVMRAAGYTATQVGQGLKDIYGVSANAAASALKYAGFAANDAANVMKNVYNASATAVAQAMKDIYNMGDNAVKSVLEGVGYAASQVNDAMKSVFDWFKKNINPKNW